MPRRLFEIYQRKRIVNINANIVASGLLAILIAKFPVHLVGEAIGPERTILVTLAAGAIDMVVDVSLYYLLHWIANHWNPPWKRADHGHPKRSFFRDASLVQFERAILSPLYYFVAMGLMYVLQERGWVTSHSWAFVIGFICGIVVTRLAHTSWGIRTGRFSPLPPPPGSPVTPPASSAGSSPDSPPNRSA